MDYCIYLIFCSILHVYRYYKICIYCIYNLRSCLQVNLGWSLVVRWVLTCWQHHLCKAECWLTCVKLRSHKFWHTDGCCQWKQLFIFIYMFYIYMFYLYIFYTFIHLNYVSSFSICSFYTNFIYLYFFYTLQYICFVVSTWICTVICFGQKHVFHEIYMQPFNTSIWWTALYYIFYIKLSFFQLDSKLVNSIWIML